MKNILIKYLSPYLTCFIGTPADQSNNLPLSLKDNLSEIITVQPLSPLSPMYPFPISEYLPKAGEVMITRDLLAFGELTSLMFLINYWRTLSIIMVLTLIRLKC
jgi:hypothetical protein